MRAPERETELTKLKNVRVFACDVTNAASIQAAAEDAIAAFGRIDALVNNAGYDAAGPLEGADETQIRRQIETNLTGTILVTKAFLPHFREQGGGVIVNLSSIAGRLAMPMQTLYHATKWGVEGFSESLQYELSPFHIRVRIIEPGLIRTDFYSRSLTRTDESAPEAYRAQAERFVSALTRAGERGSDPALVAETICRAASSQSARLRWRVGRGSGVLTLQKLIPGRLFRSLVSRAFLRHVDS